MTQIAAEHLGESLGTDFFSVREQFTDEQWSHFITVRRFVDEEVVPVVGSYWERAEICWPLVRRLPELGIVGEDIKGYGCAGMSPMACGLVTMELHRGDGSLENWRDLRAQAAQAHNHRTASYLIGTPMLADYLEEAMSQFGASFEDFEEHL